MPGLSSSRPRSLKDLSPDRLRERMTAEGLPAFRADQIAAWLYARGQEDPRQWSDLDVPLRERLAAEWQVRVLEVAELRRSADGTAKGVLRAADGALVEAVMIPEPGRTTLCVSTQVGCALACSFCATGTLGFVRNLTTAEIVDQVCRMREALPEGRSLSNVVFMGMGEPLLNLPAVVEAVRTLIHPRGFALAPRRITVSTAGLVPRIPALLEAVPVNLAVSLHATTDAVRDQLVPLNRRFPLERLFATLRSLPQLSRRRPVFFEYTLIAGVNDSPEDARRLVRLLRGLPAKLNAIPMNEHPDSEHRAPAPEVTDRFLAELASGGVTVTLRRSRGADVDAACGQLALRGHRPPSSVSPAGTKSASGGQGALRGG
jgi:23S rRNA (adenine2503-C2)-methyltransferase